MHQIRNKFVKLVEFAVLFALPVMLLLNYFNRLFVLDVALDLEMQRG